MGAIVNGIKLHGPTRPFGGTFLIFSDYMRPPVRLAALMDIPSMFVWTHDSVALGEDGPPTSRSSSSRRCARSRTSRSSGPADANETSAAWLGSCGAPRADPVGDSRSRARTSRCSRAARTASPRPTVSSKGAYVLIDAEGGTPDVILIATGSEVQLAVAARETLAAEGIPARVVSVPSLEWFAEQDAEYRESVLPASVRRASRSRPGRRRCGAELVGDPGATVGIDHFGASADYETLFQKFGITADAVVDAARATVKENA